MQILTRNLSENNLLSEWSTNYQLEHSIKIHINTLERDCILGQDEVLVSLRIDLLRGGTIGLLNRYALFILRRSICNGLLSRRKCASYTLYTMNWFSEFTVGIHTWQVWIWYATQRMDNNYAGTRGITCNSVELEGWWEDPWVMTLVTTVLESSQIAKFALQFLVVHIWLLWW